MADARSRDPALWVVAAAGGFLVWRAIFGRGLGRLPLLVAGLALVRVALGRGGARRAQAQVIEVKSPSELEAGHDGR